MKKIIKNPKREIPNLEESPVVMFDRRFRSVEEELLWRREQMKKYPKK